MGILFEDKNAKYRKLFLAAAFLIIIVSDVSTAQRKLDCRKFVFAPPCRGIAAKRDTHTHTDNIRLTPGEETDYPVDGQKISSNDNFATINGLMGFIKRAMEKSLEDDSSSNYLA